jgi:hypothetical protein
VVRRVKLPVRGVLARCIEAWAGTDVGRSVRSDAVSMGHRHGEPRISRRFLSGIGPEEEKELLRALTT